MNAFDFVAVAIMAVGLFFMLVAVIGFLRLPDVFCRLHVTSILDTLGAPLMLLGTAVLVVVAGHWLVAAKLVLALAFLFVTSPLVGHLLSRAAVESGYGANVIDESDEPRLPADVREEQGSAEAADAEPSVATGEAGP